MRLTQPALLALAFTLILPAGAPGLASETWVYALNAPFGQSPQPSKLPTIQVYSRETILDVLVTDDKGRPVHGLTKSDFAIEEDGKPRPIRSFSEYDKTTPPAAPRTLPPNTYTNSTALPANGPVQILYFDLPYGASYPPDTSFPLDTAQGMFFVSAKKYIADYLRTMPAGTQVAIFVYRSDYGLRLLQGFTTNGTTAAAAVDNLVVLSAGPPPSADPIAAANQLAAYVAAIHGRKNLIWIGLPATLPIMRDGGLSWYVGQPPDMTRVHRLMDTYDAFTREQIAIYPFDPRGVPSGKALTFATLKSEDIATETGGAAIYNTNDFKSAVAKIVADTSHFYTLSYIPPRPADDGHYHPIKITVDRPGLHLTYRNGYNDEQPATPDNVLKVHMDQTSMGLGALPSTQLAFDLQATPGASNPDTKLAKPADSRRALAISGKTPAPYSLIYKLDPSQIDFAVTAGGRRNTSLEFDLAAYDPYGKLVAVRSQTLTLTLTPEEYQEFVLTPFQFLLPIDLPRGQLTLRAGVFDTAANKAGTLEFPLAIPKK